jgi:hypothetical protein
MGFRASGSLVYGRRGLVKIADTTDDFVAAAERSMNRRVSYDYDAWFDLVDETLGPNAWGRDVGAYDEFDRLDPQKPLLRKIEGRGSRHRR